MTTAKILLIEDDHDYLFMLSELLKKRFVAKRQGAFAREWARELEIRGMLRGIVNHSGYN